MKKKLAVMSLLIAVVLVLGCAGDDDKDVVEPPTGGVMTLTAALGNNTIPSSGATILTINVNNGWNSNLEDVTVLLQGNLEESGEDSFVIDDATTLDVPGRSVGDIFTNERIPETFTVTVPTTDYDRLAYITPKICFDNTQSFNRVIWLSTDPTKIQAQPTEESQSDGPLKLVTISQINPILVTRSKQTSLTFELVNDLKSKYTNTEIENLEEVKFTFKEKSNFDIISMKLHGREGTCSSEECTVSMSNPTVDTLSLSLRANIDNSVEGISDHSVKITVKGHYCVSLPSMKLTAQGIPGS